MQKGIAWYTVFIISVIAFLTIVTILIIGKFFNFSGEKANEWACKMKVQTYCQKLLKGEDVKWDDLDPKTGCSDYGIKEPSKEECESLFT